jgi:hypothetical protein
MFRTRASRTLRSAALLAVATLCVHHLRFAFERVVPGVASHQHNYLPVAESLVGVLLLLAVAAGVVEICARDNRVAAKPRSVRWLAARNAVALVLGYVLQEALEAALTHEPVALSSILLQHGAWITLVLAPLFGLAVALVEHSADRLVAAVAERLRVVVWTRALLGRRIPPASDRVRRRVLQRDAASRAPPAAA